jgi:hypothetical protein
MGPGFRKGTTIVLWLAGTIPRLKSSNFPRIEITRFSPPNVSSPALRRNNSPGHETIFLFSRRRPETVLA